MASVDRLTALRRIRGYYIDIFTSLSKQLDEYGESDLIAIEKRLKEVWTEVTQHKILKLEQALLSIPPKRKSGTGSGPISTPPYNQTPPSSPQRSRKFTPSSTSNTQGQRKQWQRKATSKEIDSTVTSPSDPRCHDLALTAQINILNHEAHPIRCRALLDTGSSVNLVTEKLAESLGLKQERCLISIGALDTVKTVAERCITATITSMEGTYKRTMTFLVIPTISKLVPYQRLDPSPIQMPTNLQLADPRFYIPGPIDILLGVGATLGSLCSGKMNNQSNDTNLYLQETRFGWVIGGNLTAPSTSCN